MNYRFIVGSAVALSLAFSSVQAGKLPKFGAEMGKKSVLGKEIRVPYTDVVSYWGYVKPGSEPDATVDGKKMFFLYVWIPIAAPELGVRMASPATDYGKPDKTDFVSANYADAEKDNKSYFDTWIEFSRALDVINPEDIDTKAANSQWTKFDSNDDSGEMPANPAGNKYNSLLRITSDVSSPLKSLIRGLYRISFTTYKVGEVQGSFIAQVGAPIKIPGVIVAKDLKSLSEQIKAEAAAKEKKK